MSRQAVLWWVGLALGCAGTDVDADFEGDFFDDGDPAALFGAPVCESDGPCTAPSASRPQCAAAALQAAFAFDAQQTFTVPTSRTYSEVTLGARRLFAGTAGQLRVRLVEAGGAGADANPALATGLLSGALVPRTNALVTVRFQSPVGLVAGTAYTLVVDVPSGRLAIGLACAENPDAFGGGTALQRKRLASAGFANTPWKAMRRDLTFALRFDARTPGPCTTDPAAACDDGNGVSGDGCSASCAFEPGFACTGIPASCVEIDECAANTDDCDANATCTNTPGSFSCACNVGFAGDGRSCAATTYTDAWTGFRGAVGAFSDGNRTWSTTPGPGDGYRGVTLDRTFAAGEEFELVTSWAANYRGLAMVHGPSVAHTAFGTGEGVYCENRSTSGSATGTYYGQYHAPVQGGGAAGTLYYFRHARAGNVLSLGYSAVSANGPWSDVLPPVTIPASDKVVLCLGEAGGAESDPLRIRSLKSTFCPAGFAVSGDACVDVDECATNNGGCGAGVACTNHAGSYACGFADGSTGFAGSVGAFSDGNRTWSTASGPGGTYRGVVVGRTFDAGEDFEVVTSWAANYRGTSMVYGPSMSYTAFNGGDGVYCSERATSGFAGGTYYGLYHAPVNGLGAGTPAAWFRHSRRGNTLAIEYSWASATGPWFPVLAPVAVASSDKVVVCLGEAGASEVEPLRLRSLRASGCPAGFAAAGSDCSDVDECAANTDDCDANATCTNTGGSFTCACNGGYTGNGRTCNALPSNLTYAANPANYTTTVAITPNTPSNGGTPITSYSVSPALPTGLSLNTTTGVISGTPMAVAAATNHTVTGTNAYGSTQAVVNIRVDLHAPASCRDIPVAGRSGDKLYTIDPDGVGSAYGTMSVWCDMSTDGGGWTLVVRVKDGSDSAHRTAGAVGTVGSPTQTTTAKFSDALINVLRGPDYTKSVLRMWLAGGQIDYFREGRAFAALGYTGSINRVFNTWSTVLANTSGCDGTYNSTYHTGLVGWGCYDHMLYGDNPGMRGLSYQAGAVWVKRLYLDGTD